MRSSTLGCHCLCQWNFTGDPSVRVRVRVRVCVCVCVCFLRPLLEDSVCVCVCVLLQATRGLSVCHTSMFAMRKKP